MLQERLGQAVLVAAVVAVLGFLVAPIVVVIIVAFNSASTLSFPPAGFSTRWFTAFVRSTEFVGSFKVSLTLGLVAALASTAIGLAGAWAIVRSRFRFGVPLQLTLLAPLYVPRILIGVSLLLAFALVQAVGKIWSLAAAHVLITLPYCVRILAVGLQGVERSTEEAASTLGATPGQTFFRVTLPAMRSSFAAAALFAFVISFTDLYLAMFLTGAETVTVPMRIFGYLEWNFDALPAAVSAVQIGLVLMLLLIVERFVGLGRVMRFS